MPARFPIKMTDDTGTFQAYMMRVGVFSGPTQGVITILPIGSFGLVAR